MQWRVPFIVQLLIVNGSVHFDHVNYKINIQLDKFDQMVIFGEIDDHICFCHCKPIDLINLIVHSIISEAWHSTFSSLDELQNLIASNTIYQFNSQSFFFLSVINNDALCSLEEKTIGNNLCYAQSILIKLSQSSLHCLMCYTKIPICSLFSIQSLKFFGSKMN